MSKVSNDKGCDGHTPEHSQHYVGSGSPYVTDLQIKHSGAQLKNGRVILKSLNPTSLMGHIRFIFHAVFLLMTGKVNHFPASTY